MTIEEGDPKSLMPTHQCEKCLRLAARKDLNEDATITGLYLCPHCGHSGPLHIVIAKTRDL